MPRNLVHPAEQHFRVLMPAATHREYATCVDVNCSHYREGWATVVAVDSPQERYIRKDSGREFRVEETSDSIVTFVFAPGQRCFQQHTALNGGGPFDPHETREGRRVQGRGKEFIVHTNEKMDKTIGKEKRNGSR